MTIYTIRIIRTIVLCFGIAGCTTQIRTNQPTPPPVNVDQVINRDQVTAPVPETPPSEAPQPTTTPPEQPKEIPKGLPACNSAPVDLHFQIATDYLVQSYPGYVAMKESFRETGPCNNMNNASSQFDVRDANGRLVGHVIVNGDTKKVLFTASTVSITRIVPDSAALDSTITIEGSGFTKSTSVFFNDQRSWGGVTVTGSTKLTFTLQGTPCLPPLSCAYSPFSPGIYAVRVTTESGSSNTLQFTVISQ